MLAGRAKYLEQSPTKHSLYSQSTLCRQVKDTFKALVACMKLSICHQTDLLCILATSSYKSDLVFLLSRDAVYICYVPVSVLCVYPSVKNRCSIKKAKLIITQTTPNNSLGNRVQAYSLPVS